jgi:MoaA/NifB/PqqE/SkfB family radical SAM enzyme
MVFTGGDPLKRPDLFQLIKKSVELGLRTNISASATPLLTREAVREFKNAGVARMDLSLNGWDGASPDGFCGTFETFDRALGALEEARDIGLETQVLTTVTERNLWDLESIADLVERVKARLWSLFFLNAPQVDDLTRDQYGQIFEDLHYISRRASFDIHTTEGIEYRRQTGGKRIARAARRRGLFLSRARAISTRARSCRFRPVTCVTTRWARFIVIRVSLAFCARREAIAGRAADAASARSAGPRGRGPML